VADTSNSPITVDEITALSDDDLDDRVWLRTCSLVNYWDSAQVRALDPDVAAYISTRLFEWEVGNGGLHQYFFNFPDPEHLAVVLDGYSRLGLDDVRRIVEELFAPIAAVEAEWRESLRDGTIETFFDSYVESRLPEFDDRVEFHDSERIRHVRSTAEKFAR
jgi:Domain of unknown function (DUF4375)